MDIKALITAQRAEYQARLEQEQARLVELEQARQRSETRAVALSGAIEALDEMERRAEAENTKGESHE